MSKVTQIQTRLLEADPAGFQRLAEAYLRARGYDRINSFGLVLGADKTARGTPDTLLTLANGKYVFAEHTTQQTGVHDKFLADLRKCFDQEKTGIPVAQIDEVVLLHTARMAPEEEHRLAAECRRHGVRLSIYGPGTLANDLYLKYPGLARDFLGVAVDTGQIVTLDEFVASYDKSAIATPLDTAFCYREDELASVEAALDAGDLVILSGRPGVGKSRLALEACRQFSARRPEFTVRGIRYTGPDLFEDLRVHFAPPENHLVFVDDANRVSGFEHVLRLLHGGPAGRRVKVVATVRDYALDRVRELAAPYGGGVVIELGPFTDEQITGLVGDEFGIGNHLYLERIARIAGGNCRIAVMAARVAVDQNTLESIHDVSALYDTYFASIRRDLEDLSSAHLLKVAAAIALFRIIDRTDEERLHLVSDTFGVTPEAFWAAVRRLHALEIVDLYEEEVVRVSDQVLATYLFYLAVFCERVIDVTALLDRLFPAHRHRIVDALYPVLEAFGGERIADLLRRPVAQVWQRREAAGNDSLPAVAARETPDVPEREPFKGTVRRRTQANPFARSDVLYAFDGLFPTNAEDYLNERELLSTLTLVLERRLRDKLREEMAGTYGVSVLGYTYNLIGEHFRHLIQFQSDPELTVPMVRAMLDILDDVRTEGATEQELERASLILQRRLETSLQDNGYWLEQLELYNRLALPIDRILAPYRGEPLTREDLKLAAATYLPEDASVQMIVDPTSDVMSALKSERHANEKRDSRATPTSRSGPRRSRH